MMVLFDSRFRWEREVCYDGFVYSRFRWERRVCYDGIVCQY